jgi:hypothetical protein
MQIILHLKKHCIQTAAKTRYEMLMQQYFSSHKTSSKEEQENLEIEMEHLLLFLENVDFEYLRHQYPQLAGIEDTRVYLEVGHANNNFIILVDKLLINIPESINRKLNQTELTIEKE